MGVMRASGTVIICRLRIIFLSVVSIGLIRERALGQRRDGFAAVSGSVRAR